MQAIPAITVDRLARAKSLDATWLRAEFGLEDARFDGRSAVRIPYRAADGSWLFDRWRLADGTMRYRTGVTPTLYGFDRIEGARSGCAVLLVEGESDVWAAAAHRVGAIGIPGATNWRPEFAALVSRFVNLVLWEEPDKGGQQLVLAIARAFPDARVIRGGDVKDVGALHERAGNGFRAALAGHIAGAGRLYDRALDLTLARPPRIIHHTRAQRQDADISHREDADRRLEAARRRSTVDLLTERGHRVRGTGAWRTTTCPFPDHEDGTPSFSVHATAGRWRCWGCDRHGTDAIALIRQLEGLAFRDAVERVAR